MQNQEFEQRLKQSDHFKDALNTHREATAQVLAAFLGPLIESGHLPVDRVLAVLAELDRSTDRGPSVDSERRQAVRYLREALQTFGSKGA